MSEAEKSVEVEDVLSSIRRLVADGPRVDENKAQPLNLATSRIEPPLTAQTDIDEAMEELPVEEDIILETPSFVPEEDILVTSEDTIAPLPENEIPDTDGPITFVQAINASIAEMAKGQSMPEIVEPVVEKTVAEEAIVEDIAELPEEADSEARAAHVNAFLANETSMPSELDTPTVEKPEPFVLRADMVAAEVADIEAPAETDTEDDIQEEEAFEYIPDDIEEDETEVAVQEPSGDAFIDEETLREIVSELVRAELQGDLGDRITRNVRKLVRREIHHALASREIP